MNEREAETLAKAVAGECLGYRVRLLNRVITNIYDRAMQPLGLKANQANILTMLSCVRSEERRVGKECRSRWSPYH